MPHTSIITKPWVKNLRLIHEKQIIVKVQNVFLKDDLN